LNTAAGAWPFIQLYNLNPTGNVVAQYNKGGGAQTTTLTFDSVDQFAKLEINKPIFQPRENVLVTITDLWLNIDPTDEDSWTFGTTGNGNSIDATTHYQVFDEHGNSVGDTAGNINNFLTLSLPDLMCEDNCILITNADVQNKSVVITLQDNSDSRIINVDGNADSVIDPQNPLDWQTLGLNLAGKVPITITEQGKNSGIFGSYDESQNSNLIITDDPIIGSSANIIYVNIEEFFADSTENLVVIEEGSSALNCSGNPCLTPTSITILTGGNVTWFNNDVATHTIVSGNPTDGPDGLFDSEFISPKGFFSFDFTSEGGFDYYDVVHPWITGNVTVTDFIPPGVDIAIADGSSSPGCEDTNDCFIPSNFIANFGDTIIWNNTDSAGHTITSGTPGGGPDGNFDSGLILPNQEFSHQFNQDGVFPYYDVLHPWMIGSVTIAPQDCQVPPNGNWTINQNCKLTSNNTTPASVRVENNSTLTIQNGITLTIPTDQNITIESGSGVLIKSDGSLNILS
jgi:plastocyanin